MKKLVLTIFFFIIVSFNLNTNLYSDITDQLIKLDDLYQKGSISQTFHLLALRRYGGAYVQGLSIRTPRTPRPTPERAPPRGRREPGP